MYAPVWAVRRIFWFNWITSRAFDSKVLELRERVFLKTWKVKSTYWVSGWKAKRWDRNDDEKVE